MTLFAVLDIILLFKNKDFGTLISLIKKGDLIMKKLIKIKKDQKGFTLVEVIVVLVILAIMAAILIPSLIGYIDKAREQEVVSQTRMIVNALKAEVGTGYGSATGITSYDFKTTGKTAVNASHVCEISQESLEKLDVPTGLTWSAASATVTAGAGNNTVKAYIVNGVVDSLAYQDAQGRVCVYNGSGFSVQ